MEKFRHAKSYQKDYPRPQLAREAWENLNGQWDFAFDDANTGERNNWPMGIPTARQITVPFTYETKMSGIGEEEAHRYVWYCREVQIPAEKLSGRTVLHFEGVDYRADIWVNGQYAGGHTGGYARFSLDVTTLVKAGANTVAVKVTDPMDEEQPRGKQRWIDKNFGCWYVQTTGIWKTVWLEYLPESYIKAAKITPCLTSRTVTLELEAEISGAGLYEVEAEVSFDGVFAAKGSVSLREGKGKLTIGIDNTDITEWGVMKWSPDHPNLYDLALTLKKDGQPMDNALSYFGMREIRIENGQVRLNGNTLYQRLILDQGYWKDSHLTPPSEEALMEDIDKIFALGYNGLRKHQKIEDERFLYWCDVKGMLVWSEMAAAYRYSDGAVEAFTNQWMEIVRQNYNHPCIITWTPFNESWGVPSIATDKTQQLFTESIYYLTKAFDPQRPVIVNDGWEHTISDIITLHDYQESGDMFYKKYTEHKDEILSGEMPHSVSQYAFAQGYGYRGQPILISEYGGIAYNDESGWGYGNQVSSEEDFIRRFDSITSPILKIPYICGFCYTQVSDVQQEVNGLMDMERNFKANPEAIRAINTKVWRY